MTAATTTLRRELSLAAWQVHYEQRAFWRNRRAALFSFLFPLILFLTFATINKDQHIADLHGIAFAQWFLPGIMAYGIVTGAFSNLAVSMATARDNGTLKRVRGTPLPWWTYMAGRIGSAVLVTFSTTAVLLVVGVTRYDVQIQADTIPGLVLALVLGAACFSALGVGIVRFVPNAETVGPLQALLVMPVAFVSNVFFPLPDGWVSDVAGALPLKPLADALHTAFDPATVAPGIVWRDLAVLVLWIAVGSAMMVRFLRAQARQG